jgi:hypothetical protein
MNGWRGKVLWVNLTEGKFKEDRLDPARFKSFDRYSQQQTDYGLFPNPIFISCIIPESDSNLLRVKTAR